MEDDRRSLSLLGGAKTAGVRAALQRRLPPTVSVLLALVVATELASLASTLLRPASLRLPIGPARVVGAEEDALGRPAPPSISSTHLFGEAQHDVDPASRSSPPPVPTPESTLEATLTGVLLEQDGGASAAIIAIDNTQRSYRAGDAVGIGGALLREIHPDHVVVERSGQLEMLRLIEFADALSTPPRPSAPLAYAADAASALATGSATAIAAPHTRPNLPGAPPAANVIRLALYRGDDVTGLRASPGPDAQKFRDLGLKEGDIITAVNDTSLANARNGAALFHELESSPAVKLAVVRGGIPQTVMIPSSVLAADVTPR